jgi:hypothetical protein
VVLQDGIAIMNSEDANGAPKSAADLERELPISAAMQGRGASSTRGMVKQDHGPSRGGWHGADRKSRKRRLPISSKLGAQAEWTPTDSYWDRLEAAYGEKINDDLRVKIKAAVERYLYRAPFENNAPFVADFLKKLTSARKLAKELQKVVASFGSAAMLVEGQWIRRFPCDESESTHETPIEEDESAIFESAWDAERTQHRFFRNFSDTTRAVSLVLDDTQVGVTGEGLPEFAEGEAWTVLLADLADEFSSRGLKDTAAKDRDRQSPFVRFAGELQSTFEEAFRRHPTDDGLRQAISQAIRLSKTRKRNNKQILIKKREAISCDRSEIKSP